MEAWPDCGVHADNANKESNELNSDGTAPADKPNLDEIVMSFTEVPCKIESDLKRVVEAAPSANSLTLGRLATTF